jgi:hypothetical protein
LVKEADLRLSPIWICAVTSCFARNHYPGRSQRANYSSKKAMKNAGERKILSKILSIPLKNILSNVN